MSGMVGLDAMSSKHRQALDEAVEYVHESFAPWAIVASGTIVLGEGDANSDIDLYVLHDGAFRKRIQKWFNDTAVEVFVNPVSAVLDYFEEETKDGAPSTAHMLATGVAVHGEGDARLQALTARAEEILATSPRWDEATLTRMRYGAATIVEDALDRREVDSETAMRLLGRAVDAAIEYWFKSTRRYLPRSKLVLSELDRLEPDLGRYARVFWGSAQPAERWDAGLALTDRVLGTRGFFEWESEEGPV